MFDPTADLSGALEVGAAEGYFAFEALHGALAFGAVGGHLKGLRVGGAFGGDGGEDNGNDFASLFDDDAVANSNIFAPDFIFIVQGGAFDGGASKLNRF